jgi:hypothetical protein
MITATEPMAIKPNLLTPHHRTPHRPVRAECHSDDTLMTKFTQRGTVHPESCQRNMVWSCASGRDLACGAWGAGHPRRPGSRIPRACSTSVRALVPSRPRRFGGGRPPRTGATDVGAHPDLHAVAFTRHRRHARDTRASAKSLEPARAYCWQLRPEVCADGSRSQGFEGPRVTRAAERGRKSLCRRFRMSAASIRSTSPRARRRSGAHEVAHRALARGEALTR